MEILLEDPSLKTMATFYTNRIESVNNRPFQVFFQLLRWNSQEKSVNSAFLVFSQHLAWVITPVKPYKVIIIIVIIPFITVFVGVLFVHQPGVNHAPRASVTQVNHSVHTLSTFLRIRADPSMQIF